MPWNVFFIYFKFNFFFELPILTNYVQLTIPQSKHLFSCYLYDQCPIQTQNLHTHLPHLLHQSCSFHFHSWLQQLMDSCQGTPLGVNHLYQESAQHSTHHPVQAPVTHLPLLYMHLLGQTLYTHHLGHVTHLHHHHHLLVVGSLQCRCFAVVLPGKWGPELLDTDKRYYLDRWQHSQNCHKMSHPIWM